MPWKYFDHAASTPMTANALTVLTKAHEKVFANSAANHALGADLQKRLDACRLLILSELGLSQAEYDVIFLGSATEANNLVINSFSDSEFKRGVFLGDHPSLVQPAQQFEDSVLIKKRAHIAKASKDLNLLCVTQVNSQSGEWLDIEEFKNSISDSLPRLFRSREAELENPLYLHLDAAQGFAKLPMSGELSASDELGIFSTITLAAHKMGGPKGAAALVYRKGTPLKPMLFGGTHEYGLRPSTVAAPMILAWAQAIRDWQEQRGEVFARVKGFNDRLRTELEKLQFGFPFASDQCSPYILCTVSYGLPSDMVLRHLEQEEFLASSSTACSSKVVAFNETFKALDIERSDHKSILRISMGMSTTEEEVEGLIAAFKKIIPELRKI